MTRSPTLAPPLVRDVIVTLFGLYGRGDSAIPISSIIALIGTVGPDDQSVRSSVSRMKTRGLLAPAESDGRKGYRLASARASDFAAGDIRIFGNGDADPATPWSMAVFSVPEAQRAQRVLLKKTLADFGFGAVSAGVNIAPGAIVADARARIDHLGLDTFVEWFDVVPPAGIDLRKRVAAWWDLDALADDYREFVDAFAPVAEQLSAFPPQPDAECFATHLLLVNSWRELPYRDPGLPPAALPDDWPGGRARDLFRSLHAALAGPAEQFAGLRDFIAPH